MVFSKNFVVVLSDELPNPSTSLINAHSWLVDPERRERADPAPPASTQKQVQVRLDSNQELEVITAYRSGLTVYEVGARFGIHRTTVSAIMQRHGVKMRRAPKRKYRMKRNEKSPTPADE